MTAVGRRVDDPAAPCRSIIRLPAHRRRATARRLTVAEPACGRASRSSASIAFRGQGTSKDAGQRQQPIRRQNWPRWSAHVGQPHGCRSSADPPARSSARRHGAAQRGAPEPPSVVASAACDDPPSTRCRRVAHRSTSGTGTASAIRNHASSLPRGRTRGGAAWVFATPGACRPGPPGMPPPCRSCTGDAGPCYRGASERICSCSSTPAVCARSATRLRVGAPVRCLAVRDRGTEGRRRPSRKPDALDRGPAGVRRAGGDRAGSVVPSVRGGHRGRCYWRAGCERGAGSGGHRGRCRWRAGCEVGAGSSAVGGPGGAPRRPVTGDGACGPPRAGVAAGA
jgi:hypothetical protein